MATPKIGALTTNDIITALRKHHGLIRNAARDLHCSHSTLYKRIKNSEALQKVWEETRAGLIDIAESALIDKVREGDTRAIMFVLQTIGKERGWEVNTKVTLDMGTKLILEAKEALKRLPDNAQEAEVIEDSVEVDSKE